MKVNFDSFDDYTNYIKENGVDICNAIHKSIERAIKENEDEALLFEIFFAGQEFVYEITIDKPDWIDSLNRCVQVFTDNNESDKAIDAHELKLLLEDLLDVEKIS